MDEKNILNKLNLLYKDICEQIINCEEQRKVHVKYDANEEVWDTFRNEYLKIHEALTMEYDLLNEEIRNYYDRDSHKIGVLIADCWYVLRRLDETF